MGYFEKRRQCYLDNCHRVAVPLFMSHQKRWTALCLGCSWIEVLCSTISLEDLNSNLVHTHTAIGQKFSFENFASGFSKSNRSRSLCQDVLKIMCFCFISEHILYSQQWIQFIDPERLWWQLLGTWSKPPPIKAVPHERWGRKCWQYVVHEKIKDKK